MTELSPLRNLASDPPLVRQRCVPCEVAWSAPAETPCWVCGRLGLDLRVAQARREDDLLELDFA